MLNPTSVRGGVKSVGTVTLTAPAPSAGFDVNLSSSNPTKASVPTTVKILAGNLSVNFDVTTTALNKKTVVTITAAAGAVSRNAALTIMRR